MFSKRIIEISPEGPDFEHWSKAQFADYFNDLSAKPKTAKERRFSHYIDFPIGERASFTADERVQRFFLGLQESCPFFGYFVPCDPPMYVLRKIMCAMTLGRGPLTEEAFMATFVTLCSAAIEFCDVVGDDADEVETAFKINLPPQMIVQNHGLRRQAMRILHPTLMTALDSHTLRKPALREAEQLLGHQVREFESEKAFVAAFSDGLWSNAPHDGGS